MLTNSKTALALALVLASASAAMAAPKHATRQTTLQQIPAGTYLEIGPTRSTGSARSSGAANAPGTLSPRGLERLEHLIEAFQDIGFKGEIGN
jgi:hypothetical protein